jgi:hypothetical protein
MKYMPILPIGMLDIYRNNDAFILPQFWYLHEYSSFYRRGSWNTVIIDNAMYENPDMFDFQSMINIAKMLQAAQIFLVLPEDHDNPYHTIELSHDCMNDFVPDGWNPMVILHGSPETVTAQFSQLKHLKNIGFGMAVSLAREGFDRVRIYKENAMGSHYIHAMGLDNIDEIPKLRNAGFKSIDSSIPASAAWNNINLQRDREIVRTGSPDDPKRVPITHPAFSPVMKSVVTKNIALINSLCEG